MRPEDRPAQAMWHTTSLSARYAAEVTERILTDLGFDIASWIATAGLPRNEPPEPPRRKSKRRPANTPVQLTFAFA